MPHKIQKKNQRILSPLLPPFAIAARREPETSQQPIEALAERCSDGPDRSWSDAAPAARPRPHLLHLYQDLRWLPEQLESPAHFYVMAWKQKKKGNSDTSSSLLRLTQGHFWSWPSNPVHHSSCYDTTSCSKGPSFPLAHLRYHRSACRPSNVSISSRHFVSRETSDKGSQACLSGSKSSRIIVMASRIWGSLHLPLPSASASLSGLPQPLNCRPSSD